MKNERQRAVFFYLITLGMVLQWWGHSHTVFAQKSNVTETKGKRMNLAASAISTDKIIPAIDAEVATQYETASFGLG